MIFGWIVLVLWRQITSLHWFELHSSNSNRIRTQFINPLLLRLLCCCWFFPSFFCPNLTLWTPNLSGFFVFYCTHTQKYWLQLTWLSSLDAWIVAILWWAGANRIEKEKGQKWSTKHTRKKNRTKHAKKCQKFCHEIHDVKRETTAHTREHSTLELHWITFPMIKAP